jgi:hypothetical protein
VCLRFQKQGADMTRDGVTCGLPTPLSSADRRTWNPLRMAPVCGSTRVTIVIPVSPFFMGIKSTEWIKSEKNKEAPSKVPIECWEQWIPLRTRGRSTFFYFIATKAAIVPSQGLALMERSGTTAASLPELTARGGLTHGSSQRLRAPPNFPSGYRRSGRRAI